MQNYTLEPSTTKAIREPYINYRNTIDLPETLSGPEQVSAFLRLVLPDNSREHFLALYLSGSHQPIGYKVISTGCANQSLVHPREIFQPAIHLGAVALIVAHNHPSNTLKPSSEDRDVTTRIKDAGQILGIKLLDHLILTESHYYSFSEHNAL